MNIFKLQLVILTYNENESIQQKSALTVEDFPFNVAVTDSSVLPPNIWGHPRSQN